MPKYQAMVMLIFYMPEPSSLEKVNLFFFYYCFDFDFFFFVQVADSKFKINCAKHRRVTVSSFKAATNVLSRNGCGKHCLNASHALLFYFF